jgi:predicted nucleic acid-binding protein
MSTILSMDRRTESYVDTSALIAFLDSTDSHHPTFKRLFSNPPPLLTSTLVIAEGHGWFLRRFDQRRALSFLDFTQALPLRIADFGKSELKGAEAFVKKFVDQQLTLADAFGLALMQSRRITQCWSTDWHLGLTGATLVR